MDGRMRRSWSWPGVLLGCWISAAVAGGLLWVLFALAFGGHVQAISGFELIRPGMTRDDVVEILGPEDGVLRGRTLADWQRRGSEREPTVGYEALEMAGGRHLLWLSRYRVNLLSGEGVAYNVVSFDAEDRVVETRVGNDGYLGVR